MKKTPLVVLTVAFALSACATPPAPGPAQSLASLLERPGIWTFTKSDECPPERACVIVALAAGWTVEGYGRGVARLREERWFASSKEQQYSFSGGRCDSRECGKLDGATRRTLEAAMSHFVRRQVAALPKID